MANGIKLRRGLKTSLLGTLAEGELVFATDSKEIGYKQDTIEQFVSLVDINTIKTAIDHSTTGLAAIYQMASFTDQYVFNQKTGLEAAHTKANATKAAIDHSTTGLAAAHTKIDKLMPPEQYGLISFKIINSINVLGTTAFYIPIGEVVSSLDDFSTPILVEGSLVAKQSNNNIYSASITPKMLSIVFGGYDFEASGADFIINNNMIYLKITVPAGLASELCINVSVVFNSPLDGYGNAMLQVPSNLDLVTVLY